MVCPSSLSPEDPMVIIKLEDQAYGIPLWSASRRKGVLCMEKKVSCRDVGADCDFVICAKTEEEIFQKARDHAKTEHNLNEIPKELSDKMRSAIREVDRC